jgi:hypothetical protein
LVTHAVDILLAHRHHVRQSGAGKQGLQRCYVCTIMMSRTQITLDPETQRKARHRAAQTGISLAEYVRCLVARDLDEPKVAVAVRAVLDLGGSSGSDVARDKNVMLGEAAAAFQSRRSKR